MSKIFDIISQMRKLNGKFPKREQRVADFVLLNLERAAHLKQHEIAEEANVSVATVNRFCQTVGCNGFRDFNIRLAQSATINQQYLGGPSSTDSEPEQIIMQVFGSLLDTLKLVRSQLDTDALQEAVSVLAVAKRINFFGVGGGSANVAREGANRFFRLGVPTGAHADGYFQRMLSSTMSEGDVIFAISASGQPAELLDSINIARQYGAKSISLTKPNSPLSKATDISIEIDIPEDQDIYKPSASRLVFIAIIDVLAAGTARKHPAEVKEYMRRIRTSLVAYSDDTRHYPIGD